jgi:hypothetical protein
VKERQTKRLYSLAESAEYLGRSLYSMRTLVWNGEVPVVASGRKQWCDIQDLDKWIDRNKSRVEV